VAFASRSTDTRPLDSVAPARSCATSGCPILPREVRANPTHPSTEDLVTLLRSGLAPHEIQLRAARGLLPLDPEDSLRALLVVLRAGDPETAREARARLLVIPPDGLAQFVRSGGPAEDELDVLAREIDDPFVLEEIIRSRSTSDETLLHLARTATGRPQEALIANHARLLGEPQIIRTLLENPSLSSEGRRLLAELKEEFFEKSSRLREAEEDGTEGEESATREQADGLEDFGEEDDLGDEGDLEETGEDGSSEASPEVDDEHSLFIGALYRRIGLMMVSQKIKLAYTGSKEERHILIGDSNKLVGIAVLKSRAISVNEAESFAAMRNLDEEIYRRIASNREWMRKPAMVVTLVRNPRVPIDITLPLLKRLPVRDLRVVYRDRNLATVLRSTARRFMVNKRR
jgi:hypothetical protein